MKKLNELNVCGGCNAKIGPGHLENLLADLPRQTEGNLLVGFTSSDDGAVIKISEEIALIQTLDFFPPMVTDPYVFGKIAAANALSDVYAMGGKVLTALNIVEFPEGEDFDILKEILRGGAEKVAEAGGDLVGGHSIHDAKVKYGLSVLGSVPPDKIIRNNTCQLGDQLILTKPLGVGIITTGYSIGEISKEAYVKAVKSMEYLNKYAMEIAVKYRVNSCTDVTGFGLLGHLHEMLHGEFSATINSKKVPIIEEAYEGAKEFVLTAGGQRNRNHLEEYCHFNQKDFGMEELLYDPQTSGGLLFSLPKEDAKLLSEELSQTLPFECLIFGEIISKEEKELIIN